MIREQVKLPLSVALGVVLQGIRIRFGRSVVTLMGVALGIAFLMSSLAGQVFTKGVEREDNLRLEVRRRYSFLTAEMGPPRDRVLGVVQVGPLDEVEERLLRLLAREGIGRIQWAETGTAGGLPSDLAPKRRDAALETVGAGASAVLVLGRGDPPPADWAALLAGARQKVVCLSRKDQHVVAAQGVAVSALERELKEDEVRRLKDEQRRTRFRNLWIVVLSLLVTVICIANSMLMSVTERFKEIGTMKCLGALSSFIRRIFLIESGMMGLAGSILGFVVGVGFTLAVYVATYGFSLTLASVDVGRILLYSLLSVVAGVGLSIVAAIYPASVASRMVPATALRSNI